MTAPIAPIPGLVRSTIGPRHSPRATADSPLAEMVPATAARDRTPERAIVELAIRRERGHQSGCCCQGRPGLGCRVLRAQALAAGLWAEVQ